MTASRPKLRDSDIRSAVRRTMVPAIIGREPGRVIEELGLQSGEARVDIAIANGSLHGIEIKSEADTLDRLAAQVTVYSRVFDHVCIICGENHCDKVVQMVPAWWEVRVASIDAGQVVLAERRKGRNNPNLDPVSLLQLLWRDELTKFLRSKGVVSGLQQSKRKLWQLGSVVSSINEIRDHVREVLKVRGSWRVDEPRT